jgi:hypothetical protein
MPLPPLLLEVCVQIVCGSLGSMLDLVRGVPLQTRATTLQADR